MKNKAILIFSLLITFSCGKGKPDYITLVGEAQGTSFFISYYSASAKDYSSEIEQILIQFDQELSTYKPNSIINQFNDNVIDTLSINEYDYLGECFELSKTIKAYTGGYFDAGLQPLLTFSRTYPDSVRPNHPLLDSIVLISRDYLLNGNEIVKSDDRSQFNFNAIAQGLSVDVLADFFEQNQVENYMVEIGGEVRVKGKNPEGKLWSVSLESPNSTPKNRKVQELIKLDGQSVVTSGSYRKFKVIDGVKYSHAIDPFTGVGVTHNLLSVSVITDKAAVADGLATALLVMGKEKAIELLDKDNSYKASVLFIESDSSGNYTSSYYGDFEEYLMEE